ncbi:hypothetical protein Acr_04g0002450 [Actinidia rufa]|uniref:Uncharacterized protein n=1 Tax=Actinidia rufa TaxID=165716 RepID=A0A7J0EIP5_9ERIC|nr:hypothetical protein Acr_04g0002450 [Actinidia rufa]
MAMMEGLRPGPLFDSLSKNVPETISDLQNKVDKYIDVEELAEAKRRRRGKDDSKRKVPDSRRSEYKDETRNKRPNRDSKQTNERRPHTPPRRPELILPPLNAPIAQRGYLRKYVADHPPPNSPERRYGANRPTMEDIQVIHGGFEFGGCSNSSRKRHARKSNTRADEEVYNLSLAVDILPPITFSNDDLRGLHFPHDDALVVLAVIANFNFNSFGRLGRKHDAPTRVNQAASNLGDGAPSSHYLARLHHGRLPFTLQCNLGRPTLGGTRAITSTYHLKMKFSTSTGVGEVTLADPRETENTKPLEEVAPVFIHPDYPDRHVMIGSELTDELRAALTDFLKRNFDVFA